MYSKHCTTVRILIAARFVKVGETLNRIKELRKKRGLSLEQLSSELGKQGCYISSSSLSKYERGVRNPKIENWIALANYFVVSIGYLQGKSDEQNPFNENDYRIKNNYYDLQEYKNSRQNLEDFDDSHIDDSLKALIGSIVKTFNTNLYFLLPNKGISETEKIANDALYNSINNLVISFNKYIGRFIFLSANKKFSEKELAYTNTLLWLNAAKIFNSARVSLDDVRNKSDDELIKWLNDYFGENGSQPDSKQ